MTELMNTQTAPYPDDLAYLIKNLKYKEDWEFLLLYNYNRGQGSKGLTLSITPLTTDSYHPERGQNYRVNHLFIVPAASYDRRSWRRWLFERILDVEKHEAMEFFVIDGERPLAPHHGPGNDPYFIFEHGTDIDVRTNYLGVVNE